MSRIIKNEEKHDEIDITQNIEDVVENEDELADLEINPGPETALFFH